MGRLYEVLKSEELDIIESLFDPKPQLTIACRKSLINTKVRAVIAKMHGYAPDQIDDKFESHIITINPVL